MGNPITAEVAVAAFAPRLWHGACLAPDRRHLGGRGAAPTCREVPPVTVAAAARWRAFAPVLVLLAAYLVPLAVVPPTLNAPLIDDWVYQLAVGRLLARGTLWVPPLTTTTFVVQIGWGALFAWPLGIGPVALRLSTLVAGFGGTLAGYGLFRELGATRGRATVGALALWLNPVAFT